MRKCLCLFSLGSILLLAATGNCQTAVGDLNGDGKLDVVAWNGSSISVLLNDGAGNLTGAHFLAVTNTPARGVVLADFNGDGHLDILVAEMVPNALALEIFLGDGTGAFSAPVPVPTGGTVPTTNPVAADFNGDGFQDIAFSDGSTVQILLGDGKGGFSAPHGNVIALEGARIANIFVVDANNDGKPDLVANGEIGVQRSVCYLAANNNSGFTSIAFGEPASSGGSFCHPTSDLNGDGNLDFQSQFTTFFGDGRGEVLYTQPRFTDITTKTADGIPVDFDHNGTTDFVQPRSGTGIRYFPGNGHSGFGDPIAVSASNSNVIAIADLNGDGFPDLVLQDLLNPANVSVLLNPAITPVSIVAASTTQISASAATASTAAPVILIASIRSINAGSPQAAGTVMFTDGTTTLGSAPVNLYGFAAFDLTFTAGSHSTLNAVFGGVLDPATNTQFAASSSTLAAAVSVNPSAPPGATPNVTLNSSQTPARELNPVTFTATVTPSAATTFVPSGNVVFRADGDVLGLAPLQGSTAQLKTTFPNPGTHSITATYGGDAQFPPATSAALIEDIRAFSAPRSASSTQLTISPTSLSAPGQQVILKAALVGVANPPSQFVYRVNGAFLAFASQNPLFFPAFTPTGPGTYMISAEYLGDAVLAPSTASATLIVGNPGGDFSISASPGSASIKAGQSATFAITVSPANGFASATSFSCTGLPAGAACSFSPATVTPNGSPASTQLTISTTAAQATAISFGNFPHAPAGWLSLASFAATLLLIGNIRKKATRLTSVLAVLALTLFLASCGGGSTPVQPPRGTPPGISQITVSATSSLSHSVAITLTVQ